MLSDSELPFDTHDKFQVIIDRLVRGGIVKPSPPSCADIVAMLATHAWHEDVDATRLYQAVQTLGKKFKEQTGGKITIFPFMKKFPESPSDLPAPLFKNMYPEETDPPVLQNLPNFMIARGMTNCRSTGKNVRDLINPNRQPQEHQVVATPDIGSMSVMDFMQEAMQQGLSPSQAAQQMRTVAQPGAPRRDPRPGLSLIHI